MRLVRRALLAISGADRSVLAQAPTEETKQVALGGAVLTTAMLAAVSVAVALTMALDAPLWAALLASAVWGIAILNLDRWLVVASPRQRNWFFTLLAALPRVALAVVIGLVVSTPLTLQVFDDEIAARLEVSRAEDLAAFEERMSSDPRFSGLDADRERIRQLQDAIAQGTAANAVLDHPEVKALTERLATVEADYRQAELDVTCEKEGTCGSGVVGVGPAARDKEVRRDRLAAERQALTAELEAKKQEVEAGAEQQAAAAAANMAVELAALQQEVADDEAARDREVAAYAEAVSVNDGLLARIGAMHDLERIDPNLRQTHTGLFLFLTVLECLPVLFKTFLSMGKPSLYERLLHKEEERAMDRALLRHELEYDEAHLFAESSRNAARARAATQLDAEIRTAKAVLQAQVDLAGMAVERWKKNQADTLVEEVSDYLRADDVDIDIAVSVDSPDATPHLVYNTGPGAHLSGYGSGSQQWTDHH